MNIGNILFKDVSKPARYVGGEVNQVIKNKDAVKSNVVLCYPNIYEKAMSNSTINTLYTNINDISGIYCKRVFAPDIDFEKLLREKKCNIYSLEDFESVKYSDLIVFVIDSELDFTNFLNILKLSGMDLDNNGKDFPKIAVLAENKINIAPISKYVNMLFNAESQFENTKQIIKHLQNYADLNFDKNYLADNLIQEKILDYENVKIKFPINSIIPSIKIEDASIVIDLNAINEIEQVLEIVEKAIKERGINLVSFINYDKISELEFCEIVYRLKMNICQVRICSKNIDFNKFGPEAINVILPCVERSNLTFNVQTCSYRLFSKLNMGVKKEELLEKIKCVFKNNRSSIRLNFNIGLPNETFEDIDDIFYVVEEIVNMYSQIKAKDKLSLTTSINIYIPTARELEKYNMGNVNKLDTKIKYIKEKKSDPVIRWKCDSTDSYAVKLLLQNGKEDVSKILIDAYNFGARFESEETKFNKAAWQKAIFDNMNIAKKYIKNM